MKPERCVNRSRPAMTFTRYATVCMGLCAALSMAVVTQERPFCRKPLDFTQSFSQTRLIARLATLLQVGTELEIGEFMSGSRAAGKPTGGIRVTREFRANSTGPHPRTSRT